MNYERMIADEDIYEHLNYHFIHNRRGLHWYADYRTNCTEWGAFDNMSILIAVMGGLFWGLIVYLIVKFLDGGN